MMKKAIPCSSSRRQRECEIYKVTIIGSVGNFLLLLFKFLAAIIGQSAAMLADAVHSLSDFVTDIIVLLFVRISNKPMDQGHKFGHGKYETLATGLIGVILFGAGLGILRNGAASIWDYLQGEPLDEPGMLALWAAILSIVIKEILYRYTVFVGRRVDSQAVIANAWHHRSDAFSSIGTALGIGGAILLEPQWHVLDPLAAVVVSFFIMKVAYRLIVSCTEELMEKSLPEEVEQKIVQTLTSIPGVSEPHNLRTRKIGNRSAVDVHVRMNGDLTVTESHEMTKLLEERIRTILGADTFINIHVEPRQIQ